MSKYLINNFLKLGLIATIDVILAIVFIIISSSPIDGLALGFLMDMVIVLNLIVGLGLFFFKHKTIAWLIIMNAVVAPTILNLLANKYYEHYKNKNYATYYFTYKRHKFEIELEKKTHIYSFSDITEKGSSSGFLGAYQLKGDSIILLDSIRRPVIVRQKLIGYPTRLDTLKLVNKRY